MNNSLLIAAIVVVVIALAAGYYYYKTPADDAVAAAAAGASAPATHTTTYVEDAGVASSGGAYWAAGASGEYACPSGFTSTTSGFCILPKELAEEACTADDKCVGFVTAGDKHYWTDDGAAKNAQLTAKGVRPDSLWGGTVYHRKVVS